MRVTNRSTRGVSSTVGRDPDPRSRTYCCRSQSFSGSSAFAGSIRARCHSRSCRPDPWLSSSRVSACSSSRRVCFLRGTSSQATGWRCTSARSSSCCTALRQSSTRATIRLALQAHRNHELHRGASRAESVHGHLPDLAGLFRLGCLDRQGRRSQHPVGVRVLGRALLRDHLRSRTRLDLPSASARRA